MGSRLHRLANIITMQCSVVRSGVRIVFSRQSRTHYKRAQIGFVSHWWCIITIIFYVHVCARIAHMAFGAPLNLADNEIWTFRQIHARSDVLTFFVRFHADIETICAHIVCSHALGLCARFQLSASVCPFWSYNNGTGSTIFRSATLKYMVLWKNFFLI